MICELTELSKNEEAVIVDLNCDDQTKQRFLELGFLPGTKISLECTTPFGGPVTCSIRDAKIALRRKEATAIHVQK